MEFDPTPETNEDSIIKWQWGALFAALILFLPACLLSIKFFGTWKYGGVLSVCVQLFYIGMSSIINKISIGRVSGQKGYSKGTRAILMGTILLIIALVNMVTVLTPSLSKIIYPF
jgi:hypothetical protein